MTLRDKTDKQEKKGDDSRQLHEKLLYERRQDSRVGIPPPLPPEDGLKISEPHQERNVKRPWPCLQKMCRLFSTILSKSCFWLIFITA
jgi:hypothetical protein